MTTHSTGDGNRVGGTDTVALPRQGVGSDGVPADAGPSRRDELRQRAVERLMLVGTPPEERFDRLTRLAQKVFGVPVAAITVLDGDRVWPKSSAGAPATVTPRSESFCHQTVALERLLVVEDARRDGRFAALPAVAGHPGYRFYAGYPLMDLDGIAVGTFCLLAFEPRTLKPLEREVLAELASWAREEMVGSADTRRAGEVQRSLLPRRPPGLAGYDMASFCLPALTVGGDFYDYSVSGTEFRFCVADVMGKGTGAAIITATVRAVLRAAWSPGVRDRRQKARWTPGEVVTHANRTLMRDLDQTGALVTVVAAVVDGVSGQVGFADAGHGLTVVVGGNGTARWLESAGLPLGVEPDAVFADQQLQLQPGDTLLCFTDGLLDLHGGGRDGMDQIAQLVRDIPDPGELTRRIRHLAVSGMPGDDVTALAMRRRPGT